MKHDTEVFLISKTGLKVNPNDTVKVDENIGLLEREWLNVEVEIELKPGDDGYYFDEIEGPSRKMIAGYVMDEFLDVEIDSIKKSVCGLLFMKSVKSIKKNFILTIES